MPLGGALFASGVMVGKEAHMSPSAKDLIVAAPGVDDAPGRALTACPLEVYLPFAPRSLRVTTLMVMKKEGIWIDLGPRNLAGDWLRRLRRGLRVRMRVDCR
jgi:enoyl reductase-like protein